MAAGQPPPGLAPNGVTACAPRWGPRTSVLSRLSCRVRAALGLVSIAPSCGSFDITMPVLPPRPRPALPLRPPARLLPVGLAALLSGLLGAGPAPARAEEAPPWQAWPVRSATGDNRSDDAADLAPLTAGLAGVRVLGLAEQTHGGHEEFATKLRLLRHLHETQGFDVLLLESGFFDVEQLQQDVQAAARLRGKASAARSSSWARGAPGNVFYMYSKSVEGQALMAYLDQQQAMGRPLLVAGIDSQHSGLRSQQDLARGLRRALRSGMGGARGRALSEDAGWQAYARQLTTLFTLSRQAPPAAERQAFQARSQALQDALCAVRETRAKPDGAGWWCRVVRSMDAQARSLWSNGADYQRDQAMGDNAIWLMEQLHPGRKAVVWGHTVHLARGFQRDPAHLQAGEVMHRQWGAAYQVLQFSAAGGRYLDYVSLQEADVPAQPPQALEQQLAREHPGQALLVRASAPVTLPQFAYEYGQGGVESSQQPGQLGRHWDWLWLLPRISPARMAP